MAKKTYNDSHIAKKQKQALSFYKLWLDIIKKFRRKYSKNPKAINNLLHIPQIMRNLSSSNSFENQPWKISILINENEKPENLLIGKIKFEEENIEVKGKNAKIENELTKITNNISKYLNMNTTLDTLESLAKFLKLDVILKYSKLDNDFNSHFEYVDKYLNIDTLNSAKFKKYYFLLGSEGILNFSFDGSFLGVNISSDTHAELIKETKDSDSIGIIIEGPFDKVIKYYINGKYVLLDIYKEGQWESIPISSIIDEMSKNNTKLSDKAKYKIAEAVTQLMVRKRGTMIVFADKSKLEKDKTILTVSNIQLFQGREIDEIPFSSFLQMLNIDGAVVISREGKLVFSGAMIAVTPEFLVHSKTTGFGARHFVFKYLQYMGYNVLMLSEEGQLYPNITKVYSI
jgi:hypothetical protein